MSVEMVELSMNAPEPVRTAGILQQNRVFLDFFWDLAKPDQEVRLKAVEDLIQYLKTNNKADELDYTIKRLVDGLAHTREAARPGFSLALGQVLSTFEVISLQSILDRIKEKHNLQTVKKKLVRNAAFGNLFGVLALHQSSRLSKVSTTIHHFYWRGSDLCEVFEEVLLSALQTDLASAFRTPEQLQLLLVALQRFPQTLKPKKLKKLLGSSTIINAENIPKLMEVLKMASRSVKKECVLPAVALDLLKLSLKEDSFQLFWNNAIINGMLKEPPGPAHYLSFRLLGSALPLLSVAQLKEVLSGEVMMQYGEHVVSAQKAERFKLAPEMDSYVSDFLAGCQDADRQLAGMVGFSSLINKGSPLMPPVWRGVQHLQPAALQHYVEWLKNMFLKPQLDKLLDCSTRNGLFPGSPRSLTTTNNVEVSVFVRREGHQLLLCCFFSRFVFFHAFFSAKKASASIPETKGKLSVPLDDKTRGVLVNHFFGLLLSMHHLPLTEDSDKGTAANQKRVQGVRADGTMWIYHLVQYAQVLLDQPEHAQCSQPFSPEQRKAWDGMLKMVANLKKEVKKGPAAGTSAFQQLFLLVAMHLFKQEEEPEWVEVLVDILLSLLSQPSRHIRHVCRTVFSSICPHVTAAALTAILDVLDPEKDDEEDSAVVVTDDNKTQKKNPNEEDDEEMEVSSSLAYLQPVDLDEVNRTTWVRSQFHSRLCSTVYIVLKSSVVLYVQATEEDGSSDEELDDDAMMALDKGLAALFSEQKKKNQAKKDERTKIQKEKTLVRDFKIKVLDLVEVFVARQAGSPLVLGLVEPLLTIIDRGMSSDSDQQEQEFLRRAADIFRNQLCRSKVYCRTVGDRQGELHDLLDKLMTKCQKLADSSVCLYYFRYNL
uniref:MYB binding protein (P160) 1a n=1 Tax=Sander lucioperca TaxID=283035 RepID=A0A8D0D309_SANLU